MRFHDMTIFVSHEKSSPQPRFLGKQSLPHLTPDSNILALPQPPLSLPLLAMRPNRLSIHLVSALVRFRIPHMRISQILLINNPAGMAKIEQHHSNKHQRRIKHVQEVLMLQQDTIRSHDILDDTEHGPDENENAGDVQDVQVAFPWDGELFGA